MTKPVLYEIGPEHHRLFGAIIHWFGMHEMVMQYTIASIIKGDFLYVAAITTGLGYAGKRDALLSLLRVAALQPEVTEKLRWFAGELHKHNQLRNNIAHTIWRNGSRPESVKPMYMVVRGGGADVVGSKDAEQDYTVDDLSKVADELRTSCIRWLAYLIDQGLEPRDMERNTPDRNSATASTDGTPSAK